MENNQDKKAKSDAALREEAVLEFWRAKKIFEKSLKQTEGKKEFTFYEGPPTANGAPGIHHLAARAFKDAIPRYKTMRGYQVRRKGGWDTHGLAVEIQTEKKLGLNSKKAIEEYGIAKFNQACKESVWEYLDVWNKFTKRIGYWVDQDNPYVTYHNDYIESVWNVLKKVDDQKLLYKDYKVVPWCPRCGTALSSHELAQGYEDVKDLSVYIKFKIIGFPNAYFLAWTTTPWTLPGNVALAVGKDIDYVKIKIKEEFLILAKARISIITEPYEIISEMKGVDLIGLEYEPLFPYLKEQIEQKGGKTDTAFKVYGADFVNTQDGTGIVHTAVMYGQDDFELGTKVDLPKHHLVNLEGKFVKGTGFLEGRFVKEKDANGKPTLDVDIIKYLTEKNLFFNKENYQHSYPHCWRCHTALIYYARDSWYIKVSDPKIKERMIKENQEINWEPSHIRDGRFGEWLREIKDWAISRERYWGTPLPIWVDKNNNFKVIGSVEELKKFVKKSGNKYFIIRHGGSVGNLKNVSSLKPGDENDVLTENGKEQVKLQAKKLKDKPDIIISSNFKRTRETAEVMAEIFGIPKEQIIINEELREAKAVKTPDENDKEIRKRMIGVLQDLEKKYSEKNILIISHEYPIRILLSAHESLTEEEESSNLNIKYPIIQNAEIFQCDFLPLPRNNDGQIDFHRPFIDNLELVNEDRSPLIRTKEVMDVWFDSGAMPFAQDHYPFDFAQGKPFENKELSYPADFICEAIDQTRGWFYTLHAIGALLGRGKAYKNVICLGHLLDAKGKKMSKSIGNVVDPWIMMEKYGVDTLRLWMYCVNQPGESKNFDEKTVALLQQQVFGLLYNVLAFYELYRDRSLEASTYNLKPDSILDQWILAKLDELIKLSTKNLDNYKLLEPVREIRDFINDLSTWYLRRSRERIKDGDQNAKMTLYFVLKTVAKIIAPFAPFTAEDIWLKLKTQNDAESVHLVEWPKMSKSLLDIFGRGDEKVLKNMQVVREIVSLGLEARQKAGIKVRQPLNELRIKNYELGIEYTELIKEELNVKEIKENKNLETEIELDTNITPALKAEGEYREFTRELQEERKKMGLAPGDKMTLTIEKIYKKYKIIPNLQEHMLRVAAVASIICDNFNEPLPKEEIITACLLHDMGNIIKFDLQQTKDLLNKDIDLDYWGEVFTEFKKKYGENEHQATLQIIKELEVSKKVSDLVAVVDFSEIFHILDKSIEEQITLYSDCRADPFGVVSVEERFLEGKNRYKKRKKIITEEEWILTKNISLKIEKQIFAKCKIKPEDINNETVASIIEQLKNFVVK